MASKTERQADRQRGDLTRSKYASLEPITQEPEYCVFCNAKIETMNFKGTGVCGEAHRKAIDGRR